MRRKLTLPFRGRRKRAVEATPPSPKPAADPGPAQEGSGASGSEPPATGGFAWRPPDAPSHAAPPPSASSPPSSTTPTPLGGAGESGPEGTDPDPAEARTRNLPALDSAAAQPAEEGESRSRRRAAILAGAALLFLLLGGALGWLATTLLDEDGAAPAPAPTVVIEEAPEPEAAEEIGFPAFATRNTTRVGGADPIADAAGVALASHPSFGGVGGPAAVALVAADSWQAALAASVFSSTEIGAPLLLGAIDEVPDFTTEALRGLSPSGLRAADGAAVIAVGDVEHPAGAEVLEVPGATPAAVAKAVDRQRARLSGVRDPENVVVVSSEQPAFAMPAASWAARAGEPVLFADGDEVPEETLEVLARHPDTNVYVLGPPEGVGRGAVEAIREQGHRVVRVSGETPEANSIAFARFVDGNFGWNINDPGHGFVIANASRPADAGAAAPLAAVGKPGPLLVTTDAERVPPELRNFLLDTKPGFSDDPTRAVYNHVWLMGDTGAISLAFQAQVDQLVNLERVAPGAGVPDFAVPPDDDLDEAQPELEPDEDGDGDGQGRAGPRRPS